MRALACYVLGVQPTLAKCSYSFLVKAGGNSEGKVTLQGLVAFKQLHQGLRDKSTFTKSLPCRASFPHHAPITLAS